MITTDHVVAFDGQHKQHPYAAKCTRCGDMYVPNVPVAVSEWLKAVDDFTKRHARCRKRLERK